MRLYDAQHRRLYCNLAEQERFLAAAVRADPAIRLFALTLVYTGCRLSEARALRYRDVQRDARVMSLHTLKRRDSAIVREVPMPPALVAAFAGVLGEPDELIWSNFGRMVPRITAYRWIKDLMAEAGITGPQACPKGLRHGFGARACLKGIPLQMVQVWMGHASMQTTAIYATVVGPDQLAVADRMW